MVPHSELYMMSFWMNPWDGSQRWMGVVWMCMLATGLTVPSISIGSGGIFLNALQLFRLSLRTQEYQCCHVDLEDCLALTFSMISKWSM